MKKLYTLLAATAVALSTTAAAPSSLLSTYKAPTPEIKEAATFKADKPVKIEAAASKTLKTPVMKAAPSANICENVYWETYYSATEDGGWSDGEMIYFLPGAGNSVTLGGFYSKYIQNLQLTGTYDQAAGTISIPARSQQFDLRTQTGTQKAYFCIIDVTKTPYTRLDDDIVFHVDKQSGVVYYEAEANATSVTKVIALATDEGFYDYISAIDAAPVNSAMQWQYPIFSADGQSITSMGQAMAYVWADVNGDKMTVTNMLNAGAASKPVEFTFDYAAKTATATDALLGQARIDQQTVVDFYLQCMKPDDTISTTVVLNMAANQYEDGTPCTVFSTSDLLIVSDKTLQYLLSDQNFMCTQFQFVVDGDLIAAAGVEDITVADENAPVEYYNLQGVKVANPESGLYIRRQGNTATKVLIK